MNKQNIKQEGALTQLWQGICLPFEGLAFMRKAPGARRWAIMPLFINMLVYALILILAFWLVEKVHIPEVHWEFWWGLGSALAAFVNVIAPYFKWIVSLPLIFTICYFSFTFMGMLIAAPFNDILSEKIETYLTGYDAAGDAPLRLTLRAMYISLLSSLRFAGRQIICALLCLPLLFIPVAGVIIMFVAMSYYAGLGFLDIGMARNFLAYRHKMVAARENRWRLIGIGLVMELLFLIPLTGLLVLPLGVAGGTLLYCRLNWADLLQRHNLQLPEGFIPPQIKITEVQGH